MHLSSVYIRFYKSFNFGYLRKSHPDAEPKDWETTREGYWYPYVRVPVEDGITTVVGANESGKSQLLSAVECALTGKGIRHADFCRYSQFFAVDQTMRLPDFGLEFRTTGASEQGAVAQACAIEDPPSFERFSLFRAGDGSDVVYLRTADGLRSFELQATDVLDALLPAAFRIDADVPLPESVPIRYLATGVLPDRTRESRRGVIGVLLEHFDWFSSPTAVAQQAEPIASAFADGTSGATEESERELRLADDLLVKVAEVDRAIFAELQTAIARGEEGYANGLVERINAQLALSLDFPKWWSQDREFELLVTLRDLDLVFTIRDRTGTEYSFDERSAGLKFFLSYFVQYLAHTPREDGRQEILLMDEPDAYLSSQGQQDLLRIFDAFAFPTDASPPCQVIYVTHSPFLIDKNHADRIRVLEKGDGDEGTRVVRDIGRNHYEPLRSAFGSFVGETTFMANCNLVLEGPSDQIILAGMSARLHQQGAPRTENLDLNSLTLVPAGSASQVPYCVYLARGRDVERPAVMVLLDSDDAGDDAKKRLATGPWGKTLLDQRLVLQLRDIPKRELKTRNPDGVVHLEDLVPLAVGLAAARSYVSEYLGDKEVAAIEHLTPDDLTFTDTGGTHKAVENAIAGVLGENFHLDKVGFARGIVRVSGSTDSEASRTMSANFQRLFKQLSRMQRVATRERMTERTSSRVDRARRSFLLDHPDEATREEAGLLFEEIDAAMDASIDADQLRLEMRTISRDFLLDDEVTMAIENYPAFKDALMALVYQERRKSQDPE